MSQDVEFGPDFFGVDDLTVGLEEADEIEAFLQCLTRLLSTDPQESFVGDPLWGYNLISLIGSCESVEAAQLSIARALRRDRRVYAADAAITVIGDHGETWEVDIQVDTVKGPFPLRLRASEAEGVVRIE